MPQKKLSVCFFSNDEQIKMSINKVMILFILFFYNFCTEYQQAAYNGRQYQVDQPDAKCRCTHTQFINCIIFKNCPAGSNSYRQFYKSNGRRQGHYQVKNTDQPKTGNQVNFYLHYPQQQ